MHPFKKLKQRAQTSGGAWGNKHVDKWLKRKANRFIRHFMRGEKNEYQD